jgi:hypothetical protein
MGVMLLLMVVSGLKRAFVHHAIEYACEECSVTHDLEIDEFTVTAAGKQADRDRGCVH